MPISTPEPLAPGAPCAELIRVVLAFTALTAAMTYPQVLTMGSHMAGHYDTLFSVWRLAWVAHQLPRAPLHLFDANIFFPQPNTLAYSDALLLQAIGTAPLLWMGVPAIVAHNLLVFLSFVLCGLSMYVCVRALTGSPAAAWLGSVVFAFQLFRIGHYGQLETLWAWPIPLALLALHRLIARPRLAQGLVLGLLVAVQTWCCLYYGVFLITGLVIVGLVLVAGRPRAAIKALMPPLLAAAVVAALLIGTYAIPYLNSTRAVGLRSEQNVRDWSAIGADYLATPVENWLYGRWLPNRSGETILFPGLTAIALAAIALTRRNRWTIAYATLLVVAADLTFGFSGGLYRFLFETVWVYRGLRVPARLFVLVSVALSILAGFGVSSLMARAGRWGTAMSAALVGAVLLESLSVPLDLHAYVASSPPLYRVLRQQPPGAVLEWPLPRASAVGQTHDPLYMYFSTFHWHPLANGYSGNFPDRYIFLLEQMETFPSPDAMDHLRRIPVRYIVLHQKLDPDFDKLRQTLSTRADVGLIYAGSDGMGNAALFELR